MKKGLLNSLSIFMMLISFTGYAQPTVLYTGLTTTTPAPSNSRFTLNTVGGFRQVRFQSNQSVAVSTTGWAFHSGSTGTPNYSPSWRPLSGGNTLSSNNFIPTSFANGAKYSAGGSGTDGLLPAITSGNYYTFNVSANAAADNVMELLETSFNPVTVSAVSQAVGTYGSRTVSITTSGTPDASENIYVRYSTNSYTSSTIVQATGGGTAWSATIPWQTGVTSFYVYTSNKSKASIDADVVTYGQGVHDMSTLNLNNNGGTNYSWTPPTGNVIVSSAGGTFATPIGYSTFTVAANAFAALNGAAVGTGAVTILITGNTTETGAITLNNSANWTSIGIRPNGARTISGSVTVPMIGIAGGDNVTIDGLNTGGNSLIITNTNTNTTSGLSTITFSADATNNTITNCSILGSSPNTNLGNANGVIVFSTSTTSGNDGNTISNCTISAATATLPSRAIHSVGSTNNTTRFNSGITINNCLISDYFISGNVHAGIYLGEGNTDWTISNNRFFQSASRVAGSTSAQHSAINIGNGSSTNTGNNYTISGNTFGYATSAGTGNYVVGAATFPTASGSAFAAIRMIYMAVGTATASNIQGNTFANINFATTGTGTANSSKLTIVYIVGGVVNIGNTTPNTFGGATGTGSIAFSTNQSGANDFNVVYNFGLSSFNCSNNIFGSITATTTNAGATTLYVIRNNTDAAVTFTCQGNTVGGTTASSIQNTSTNAAGGVTAIQNELAIANISTNTITNLTAAAASGNVRGINNTSGEALTINQNTINTLSGTGATAPVVSGISVVSGAAVAISKNKIYDLAASSAGGTTNGIITSTAASISNNIIGDLRAATGSTTAPAISVAGINVAATTGTVNVYYNTVNLSAAAGGTNFGTAALYANTGSTLNSINNILVNTSVANGTGKATAYQRSNATLSSYASTSNNNLYYSGTPGASRVIFFDGTNSDQTLSAYKTRVSTRDNLSVSENPTWVSTTGSASTFLHIDPATPTAIESGGVVVSGFTDDFDAVGVRSITTPDIGADEFTGTPLPAPDVTGISPSALCAGITDVVITGTGFNGITAVNFNGVASSFIVNSSTQITATTPLTATAGTIQVVNSTGSDVSSAYTISTQSVAPSSLVAAQPTICNGASTSLTQTGGSLGTGANWQWYTDNNFTTTVGSPTGALNASLSVSPTTTTTYYLRAINGTSPCATDIPVNTPATISVTVTVNAVPTATATNSGPYCVGNTIQLTGGPNGMASYGWTGPNGFSIVTGTQSYSQDFNTLNTSGTVTWTDNTTIANWYSQRSGTGAGSIIADAGTATTGALYSYGTGTATDRALGTIGSGTPDDLAHGVLLQNTTGGTVTSINVTYTLEQWRKSGVTVAQDVTFWYRTSSSPITALTPGVATGWTQVAGLTTSSPINTATGTALDGNNSLNRVTLTNIAIPGISLANNDYIMLKWEDIDHTNTDHGLAIDDVSVLMTAPGTQNPSIPSATTAMAGVYTLTVTSTAGCTDQETTTVVVSPTSAVGAVSPDESVCSGNSVTSDLTIASSTGTVQWQYADDPGFTINLTNTGTNSNTLTIAEVGTLTSTRYFRAVVTSGTCSPATSGTITITVNPPSAVGAVSTDQTICSGNLPNSDLTIASSTGTVQWERADDLAFTLNVTPVGTNSNTLTSAQVGALTATRYFRAVVTSGACAPVTSGIITITVDPVSAVGAVSSDQVICYGSSPNTDLTIASSTGTVQWQRADDLDFTVNVTNVGTNSNTLTIAEVGSLAATRYFRAVVTSGTCSPVTSGIITVTTLNIWLGGTGDWNTGGNWCTGVTPLSTDDVLIPAAATPYPVLSAAATTRNLNIESGATVTIGSNTITINGAVSGTGTLTGSNTSGLTVTAAAGTLRFTSGGTNNYLNALTIGASGSATLGSALNITAFDGTNEGVLTVTPGGTLASGGFLSIRSNINGTARIAPGSTSGGYITGGVSVERYIPLNASKAWRLLGTNASGQTINFCWQEGAVGGMVNPVPGFGTKITRGNVGGLAATQALGFDTLSLGAALFSYNPATDGLEAVAATNTGNIASEQGYFLFIRGDRSPGGFGAGAPTAPTVLRIRGSLFQGDQAQVFTGTPGYALVRNPYPSRIDMRNIVRGSLLVDAFQVWDAKIGGAYGVGGYQTFTKSGADYVVTPGGGSYGSNGSTQNFIESGAAFYVQATANNGVDNYAQVTEACKTSASSNASFRPSTPAAGESRLSFSLFANNIATYDVVDGGLVFFGNSYSNDVTVEDVRKNSNFNENFGMVRSNVQLVVEKRQQANVNDTIFFNMNQLRQIEYRLDIEATNMDPLITTAVLEDRYTNTITSLDLGTLNSYSFTVDATAASKAADRFRIVFRQAIVVPVNFVAVKAAQSGRNISVEWKVENEVNTVRYEIEKSADGRNFSKKGIVAATGNGSYNWLDENAVNGYNYYRIRSVDNNGVVKYTQVVKVQIGGKAAITVSPNPVQSGFINIQFAQQEAGKYGIRITNITGQAVYNREVTHNGGSASQSFVLPSSIVNGIYLLEVIAPDKSKHTEKLLVNQGN